MITIQTDLARALITGDTSALEAKHEHILEQATAYARYTPTECPPVIAMCTLTHRITLCEKMLERAL